jgi:hypothetical protein
METLLKMLTLLLPFLAQCPHWVRVMVVIWVLFTAVLAAALLSCLFWSQKECVSTDLQVVRPIEGEQVQEGAGVEFCSVYDQLNHYITVTPLNSPDRWIVDGPIRVTKNIPTTGRARFGNALVGRGEDFAISVLATNTLLQEGVLQKLPSDARLSKHVVVMRMRR